VFATTQTRKLTNWHAANIAIASTPMGNSLTHYLDFQQMVKNCHSISRPSCARAPSPAGIILHRSLITHRPSSRSSDKRLEHRPKWRIASGSNYRFLPGYPDFLDAAHTCLMAPPTTTSDQAMALRGQHEIPVHPGRCIPFHRARVRSRFQAPRPRAEIPPLFLALRSSGAQTSRF
jgi:hypothetical protein